jgi:EAL domain-containing protein (putative c-di-GMP-specific phosphodiesterase class I)
MGHSSLLYLRQFPVDVLKIDGSLSRNVLTEIHSAEIIQTIATMCQSLKIEMMVEFVETEKQLEKLIELGAQHFQGYLFSQPLPAEEALFVIQQRNKAKR